MASASFSSCTFHARFVASMCPCTTGPATPKQACVMRACECRPTNSLSMSSSESNRALGKLSSARGLPTLTPPFSKSATFVFVPPMSPAIIICFREAPPAGIGMSDSRPKRREQSCGRADGALVYFVSRKDVEFAA